MRLVCLVNEKMAANVTIRQDLMSTTFPSIWIEIKSVGKASAIIGGFYREWSHNGVNSVPMQIRGTTELSNQIERANEEGKPCIVMGDANLSYQNWKSDEFNYKSIAEPLLNIIEQCGFNVSDLGTTFNADHAQVNGIIAESGIDHIYTSKMIEEKVTLSKLANY